MTLNPVVQLLHISDTHVASDAKVGALLRRKYKRWPNRFRAGFMGHDPNAFTEFERSMLPALSSAWRDRSCLVATGDLSTLGDRGLRGALRWIARIASAVDLPWAALYGNHDVWAGDLPLRHPDQLLDARRTALRRTEFIADWPCFPHGLPSGEVRGQPPLEYRYGSRGKTLTITSLNTIEHGRVRNTLAYGRVREDRYWEPSVGADQVSQILLQCCADETRIVLTHHPIHFPNPPLVGLVLDNSAAVAQRLASQPRGCLAATAVISGHTHDVFPKPGALPGRLPRPPKEHQPLASGQVQLIGGTLSQQAYPGRPQEHTWQLLRFYEENEQLVLKRTVFRRNNRAAPFKAIPDPAAPTKALVETMVLQ